MDFWVIFITGLTTGGLTCLAIQGGLLATAISPQVVVPQQHLGKHAKKKQKKTTVIGVQTPKNIWPVVYFLGAKLLVYTVLGFLLGTLGAAFHITRETQAVMHVAVGLFMLATALNMLNVHPIFRYFVIQPPKALTRLVRNRAKSQDVFAPVMLGFMTVLIPCGTTQAMEVLAISSGSPVLGALIMFVFVLGTSPTFLVLGFLATQIRGKFQPIFAVTTALLILFLGMVSLNSGLILLDSPLAPERVIASVFSSTGGYSAPVTAEIVDGVQELTIWADGRGYTPNNWKVASDTPIRLRMVTENSFSCSRAFTIPSLGVERILPDTGVTVIDLLPQAAGKRIYFTCSMGMYGGIINVENSA
jgi:sulfite exporter TauE/SafE